MSTDSSSAPTTREVEMRGLHYVISPEPSEQGEPSLDDEILLIDNLISEDAPLIVDPNAHRPAFGSFKVDLFVTVCYQYIRLLLALGLFVYLIYMMFSKHNKADLFYVKRRSAQPELPYYSSKDVRVVVAAMLTVLFGPAKLSVLFNLFHRKTVTQLKFTLVFFILFILNCSEDEYNYTGVVFIAREAQEPFARLLTDLFYGFSVQRTDSKLLSVCYFIFDLVLYPNAVFFLLLVALFFLVVSCLCVVALLNYLGVTHVDLEENNRANSRRQLGLTAKEVSRLQASPYKKQPPAGAGLLEKPGQSRDESQGSEDSGVSCSICYIPLKEDAQVVALPQCEHLYHQDCIVSWFKTKTTCPICRLDIRKLLARSDDRFNIFDKLNHSMLRLTFE